MIINNDAALTEDVPARVPIGDSPAVRPGDTYKNMSPRPRRTVDVPDACKNPLAPR
jgi:hypothetical protein